MGLVLSIYRVCGGTSGLERASSYERGRHSYSPGMVDEFDEDDWGLGRGRRHRRRRPPFFNWADVPEHWRSIRATPCHQRLSRGPTASPRLEPGGAVDGVIDGMRVVERGGDGASSGGRHDVGFPHA